MLSVCWCNTVLNVHVPSEGISDDSRYNFYEKMEHFCKVLSAIWTIMLCKFNAKFWETLFSNRQFGMRFFHQDCNDSGDRIIISATSRNLYVESTNFHHRSIHKNPWTSPDGKTDKHIDHILIDRRWHSNILDVRSFRVPDCNSNQSLVVASVSEIWQ